MKTIAAKAMKELRRRHDALTRLRRENTEDEQVALSTRSADWPDLAQEQETAAVLERLSDRERLELREVDDAMMRLRDGSFGTCARCGGAIGRQRLLAVPEARLCVICESAAESSGVRAL